MGPPPAAEYINGNQNFVAKIDRLEATYGTFRRTRGDGNCFFRGFVFAYLEGLLLNRDAGECSRCVATVCHVAPSVVLGGKEGAAQGSMRPAMPVRNGGEFGPAP